MEIREFYNNLYGKQMSPEVEARFLKIGKALGIQDNDAIWQIVFALDFYQDLYGEWPKIVRTEVETVTRTLKETSSAIISLTTEEIKKAHSAAVLEIQKSGEQQKVAMAKALDATLPFKLNEVIFELAEREKKRKGVGKIAVITASLAVIMICASGLGVYEWASTSAYEHAKYFWYPAGYKAGSEAMRYSVMGK